MRGFVKFQDCQKKRFSPRRSSKRPTVRRIYNKINQYGLNYFALLIEKCKKSENT